MKKSGRHMYKLRRATALLVLLLLMISSFPFTTKAENLEKRTVRVGYYSLPGFQECDEDSGEYRGYSFEFLMALQQYTNWSYEFVPCTFADGLKMLENGELDLVNNVSRTKEREEIFEFSSLSSGENTAYLSMKAGDARVAYNDIDAIGTIKIGLDKASIYSERLTNFLAEKNVKPQIVWYDSQEMLAEAFEAGKIDAHIITSSSQAKEHIILSFSPDAYYLAATKGNTGLIDEVDTAIEALRANDPYFELHLQDKYYGKVTENYTVFTREEEQYIKETPEVRVLYQPDWYPICYKDEKGDFAGALRGVYNLLEERTGLKFKYVPVDPENNADNLEGYNCQILAEQPADFSGAGVYDVKLTKSFISPPLMEVANQILSEGDSIALVEGDYLSDICQRIYGEKYEYVYFDSIDACMNAVKNEMADGTVLISYESEYYRQQHKYSALTYTIIDEGSYGLAIAISNSSDPRLYSIIEKGLNSISTGEISNVFNQTIVSLQKDDIGTIIYENPFLFAILFAVFFALLFGIVLGWFFIKKLKSQNQIIHQKNEELLRANQATTNFFSRMSHDMRTPMNGILGVARLSKEESDLTTLKNNMKKVEDSGEYLLSLINDTLDFQRIESGNLQLKPQIVNCNDIFENIAEIITPAAKNKKIDFRIENKNVIMDCFIWADPVRIKQIFINLLSNAIKFTPEYGTISVEYECTARHDMVSHALFYIRDTGVGMSEDFIAHHMFQPFSQEQNEVTGQYAGSGLGLSIVKSLIDLMGGTIEVESEIGAGTTFIINLDFEKVKEEEILLAKEKHKTAKNYILDNLHGQKILLVEDHPLNAEIAKKLLEKTGCAVEWAKNGQEGVELFIKSEIKEYSAILMDIRMPVMNGMEATMEIRKLKREDAKRVPIIAMTANAYEDDIKQAIAVGMNAHIAKPVNPELLYKTIAEQLNL